MLQNSQPTLNELDLEQVSIPQLDLMSQASSGEASFDFEGEPFKVSSYVRTIVTDKSDFVLLVIWDEHGDPVAYVDSILLQDSKEALIDFKAHNYVFRDNRELLRRLDVIYTEEDNVAEKTHAAFFVQKKYRGTGLSDALQSQTKYLLNRMGANRIVYAGDTTVAITDQGPSSFYARNAVDWQIELNPIYEEGAPYTGPRTTISTQLSDVDAQKLREAFISS